MIVEEIVTTIIMFLFGLCMALMLVVLLDTLNDERSMTCSYYYNTTKPLPWFCSDTP